MIAAEYHIGTKITTDKQAACVVTEHICVLIFFPVWMYVIIQTMIYFIFSVLGVVDITLTCCEVNYC